MSTPKLPKILTAALCAAALGGGVCLYAALAFDYDIALHPFSSGSPAAAAAAVLCLCAVLIAAAQGGIAHFTRSRAVPAAPGTAVIFGATLTGFLLLGGCILGFTRFSDLTDGWMERIRLAAMALSAFWFLAVAPRRDRNALSPISALVSLTPILYAFLSVMTVYFDTGMGMNAPLKTYLLMMYLAMALYFTAEARATLGRVHAAGFTLFAGLYIALGGTVGLSTLAISLYDTQGFGFSVLECAASFAVAVFAAIRLFTVRAPEENADEQDNA